MDRAGLRRAVFGGSVAALLMAGAVQAGVHRCTVDGKTVYSDVPCATEEPAKPDAPAAPPPAAAATPPTGAAPDAAETDPKMAQFRELVTEIRIADSDYRSLQAKMRVEGEALEAANKQATDSKAANDAVIAFNQRWNETLDAARKHREKLQRELQGLCPNGAVIAEGREQCR